MGSKPKQSEYKPSATEKTQAAIAAADNKYFRETYDPLLVELRDKAATENVGSTLRGRAQADTYQALTGEGANLDVASDVGTAATLAVGATGQILDANKAAKNAKVTEQVGVLGTARGQAADAGDALAKASKLARSEGLSKAQAKQTVRLARRKAAFDIGMALGEQGLKNKRDSGSFFTSQSPTLSKQGNNVGYQQYGPFGKKAGFSILGSYMPTPTDTGG